MKHCLVLILALLPVRAARGADNEWQDVFAKGLDAFKAPHGGWTAVADVGLDPKNPRKLLAKEGTGAYYNGTKGRTNDLFTKEKYGDLEVHLEFLIPKGSNSGIKFHGH